MDWDVPGTVNVHGQIEYCTSANNALRVRSLLNWWDIKVKIYLGLGKWQYFTSEYRFEDKTLWEFSLRHEPLLHQVIWADTIRTCDLKYLLCLLLGLDPNIVEYYAYGMSRGIKVFSINIQGSDSHMINWEISMRKAELVLHKDCFCKAGIVGVKTTWVNNSLNKL